jgi:hypothetical protein
MVDFSIKSIKYQAPEFNGQNILISLLKKQWPTNSNTVWLRLKKKPERGLPDLLKAPVVMANSDISVDFVGFRPLRSFLGRCLIFVGWVEVRNPT